MTKYSTLIEESFLAEGEKIDRVKEIARKTGLSLSIVLSLLSSGLISPSFAQTDASNPSSLQIKDLSIKSLCTGMDSNSVIASVLKSGFSLDHVGIDKNDGHFDSIDAYWTSKINLGGFVFQPIAQFKPDPDNLLFLENLKFIYAAKQDEVHNIIEYFIKRFGKFKEEGVYIRGTNDRVSMNMIWAKEGIIMNVDLNSTGPTTPIIIYQGISAGAKMGSTFSLLQ